MASQYLNIYLARDIISQESKVKYKPPQVAPLFSAKLAFFSSVDGEGASLATVVGLVLSEYCLRRSFRLIVDPELEDVEGEEEVEEEEEEADATEVAGSTFGESFGFSATAADVSVLAGFFSSTLTGAGFSFCFYREISPYRL